MMRLTLAEVLEATGGRLLARTLARSHARTLCRRISTDSRTLRRGDWFVALRGENFDGHDYLPQVIERGARVLIVSRVPDGFSPRSHPLILVGDTLRALGDIAALWRRKLRVRVIAVTGSSGKTTTKDLLGAIMARHAPTLVTQGNLNNLIGVPHMVQRLAQRHRWAVFEIGMNLPGEIDRLADIISPRIGLITNIGDAHAGNFPSGRRGVFAAKAELLGRIERRGALVLNADDTESTAALAQRAHRRGLRVLRFSAGANREADLWVESVEPRKPLGHCVVLATHSQDAMFALPIIGLYNVANLAAAATAALAAGVPLAAMPRAVKRFKPTGMRSLKRDWNGVGLLVDCYNANPQSMAHALASLGSLPCAGRRVALLGDMFELGRRSASLHRAVGTAVAKAGVDQLVTFGKDARLIAERARGVTARHFDDPEECARHLRATLRSGDLLLVKGSRAMAMERILQALERAA
jgi:UDP-N-acetylmuramoyl-tripeptide--D-alanyl-D-alanine ligase